MATRAVIIIPWYRPDDYDTAVSLFGDLPESYGAWRKNVLHWESRCQDSALACLRVLLRPDEFYAWCQTRRYPADASTRSAFMIEKARVLVWPDNRA